MAIHYSTCSRRSYGMRRELAKVTEDFRDLIKYIPCLPCRFLALSSAGRYHITSLKAWQYIIPFALAGPMTLSSSCIGIHFMPTPWPKVVHKVSTPISCSCGNTDTAITTISGSLVLITRALLPSIAASRACINVRVSASSCRHVNTASNDLWLSLQMTTPSFVTRIVMAVCAWQNSVHEELK